MPVGWKLQSAAATTCRQRHPQLGGRRKPRQEKCRSRSAQPARGVVPRASMSSCDPSGGATIGTPAGRHSSMHVERRSAVPPGTLKLSALDLHVVRSVKVGVVLGCVNSDSAALCFFFSGRSRNLLNVMERLAGTDYTRHDRHTGIGRANELPLRKQFRADQPGDRFYGQQVVMICPIHADRRRVVRHSRERDARSMAPLVPTSAGPIASPDRLCRDAKWGSLVVTITERTAGRAGAVVSTMRTPTNSRCRQNLHLGHRALELGRGRRAQRHSRCR